MLINRAGGGGGSLDITNGRIEDLYAMDEDVPANTFVELIDYLYDDPEHPALSIKSHCEMNTISASRKIVKLSDSLYLMFTDRDVYSCVIDGDNISVTDTKSFTTSGYKFNDAEKFSANSAIVVANGNSNYGRIQGYLVTINENNSISIIDKGSLSTSLYPFNARVVYLSDRKALIVWNQTDDYSSTKTSLAAIIAYNDTFSSIITIASNLFEIKPQHFKVVALSETKILCAFDTYVDTSYRAYLLALGIDNTSISIVAPLTSIVETVDQDVSRLSICGIDNQRALILDEGFNSAGSMFSSVFATIVKIDGRSISIIGRTEIASKKEADNIGDVGDSFDVIQAIKVPDMIFAAIKYTEYVRITVGSYNYNYRSQLAVPIEVTADDRIIKKGLSKLVEGAYTTVLDNSMFASNDETPIFIASGSGKLNFWSYMVGELVTVVQNAAIKIDGITKTKATPDQKGKVWLLDSPGI